MKETLRRIGNVIAFMLLWFSGPLYLGYMGQAEGLMLVWLLLGWLPAMLIMLYITDSYLD